MQTQSACLTSSLFVRGRNFLSVACHIRVSTLFGNLLRLFYDFLNLRISRLIQGRGLASVFRPTGTIFFKIFDVGEKKLFRNISPFRTMTLLLYEGMLYSSFGFLCIFWADSCHFVIYISRLTLELLGLLNFGLRLSFQFTSVIFLSKLCRFCRFLVLASVSGFSTSLESCTSVQSREKLHVQLEKERMLFLAL